jgi:predicted transposase YbfD/YdcC
VHLVRAWAAENRLVLGHVAVDATSNDITAIPQVRDLLDLRGSTVTIDAMGTQTAIAERMMQRGGQSVLALKEHQPTLYADVVALFADARAARQKAYGMPTNRTVTKDHGRIETRQAFVIHDPVALAYLNERQRWAHVTGVALIEAERTLHGVTTTEQR